MKNKEELLTPLQVAKRAGVTKNTVYKAIRREKLRKNSMTVYGRNDVRIWISKSNADKWIASRKRKIRVGGEK